MPRRTSLPVLLASVLVASGALAAPDEEALGRAEGYPICRDQPLRPLKRAPAEPAIRYRFARVVGDPGPLACAARVAAAVLARDPALALAEHGALRAAADAFAAGAERA